MAARRSWHALTRRGSDRGGRRRRERNTDPVVDVLFELPAVQQGVGVERAALIDKDDISLGIDAVSDHEGHFEGSGPAGPARQVHDRVGLGRGRDGGCARHEDADAAPLGLGPSSRTLR